MLVRYAHSTATNSQVRRPARPAGNGLPRSCFGCWPARVLWAGHGGSPRRIDGRARRQRRVRARAFITAACHGHLPVSAATWPLSGPDHRPDSGGNGSGTSSPRKSLSGPDFRIARVTGGLPRLRGVEPLERPGRCCSVVRGPERPTEHVLFRYDAGSVPSISFYSLPHGCAGVAKTLDEARNLYRSTMCELLGVSRRELPPVVEHLEAVVADMWVRTEVGAVHRDPLGDRMFLQTLLLTGPAQDAMHADLGCATDRGASPVVVIVEPYDAVGAVLDQMRAADAVLVVHCDARNVLGWVTIYGPNATGADDIEPVPTPADLPTRPITFLTDGCFTANRKAVRLQTCQLD
jgi:hypothetical protein